MHFGNVCMKPVSLHAVVDAPFDRKNRSHRLLLENNNDCYGDSQQVKTENRLERLWSRFEACCRKSVGLVILSNPAEGVWWPSSPIRPATNPRYKSLLKCDI
jgi:hypothetical protein